MTQKAAISYNGGKGGVFQKIINLIPPHKTYIETHLGSGAVFLNKRPASRNIGIDLDLKIIAEWNSKQNSEIKLVREDAVTFLKQFKFTGQEFVYCDPPYLRETRQSKRDLYDYEYTTKQHKELLKVIKSLPCMVMISGYKSDLYSRTLKKWNTATFQAKTRQGIATEWVWFNYPPPVELHDYRHLGDTFRERERIKRKINRWIVRLEALPVLERQALMAAIENLKK